PPEPAQLRDRLAVVVGGARPAVADHDGRPFRGRAELAGDAVPRLVPAPAHPALLSGHLRSVMLRRAGGQPARRCVRMRVGVFLKGALVGGIGAAAVLVAAAAFGGSGVHALFNLGETNTINAQSVLKGSTANPLFLGQNTSSAAG